MSSMYTEHSAAIAAPPQRRRRPPLSCSQCRHRKIKCDQKKPCNQCKRSKDVTCVYTTFPDSDKSRSQRVQHTPTSEGSFQIATPSPSTSIISFPTNVANTGQDSSQKSSLGNTIVQKLRLLDVCALVGSVNQSPPVNLLPVRQHTPGVGDVFYDAEREKQPCRFVGETHWMNQIMQFDKVVSCFFGSLYEKGPQSLAELRELVVQCKALERALLPERPLVCLTAVSDIQTTIPSKDICDELIGNYFRTYESIYRVIHIPSFLKRYDKYWSHPGVEAIGSTLQLPSVGSSSLRSTARQWVFTAQTWLLPLDKTRMNIPGIQIQCLLLLARETLGIGSDFLWISAGSLMRTAMQLGYHRDPKYFAGVSVLHGELRRRLWATIMEFAIKESFTTAMPPLITMEQFDTEPPANINDADIDQETEHKPIPRELTSFTQASVQIILLRSLRSRLAIATLVTNFRSQLSYEEVLQLYADITSAYRNMHALEFTNNNESFTQFQRNFIEFVLLRPVITLHQPWAIKARSDPRYYFSRKVCLDTCLSITSFPPCADYSRLLTTGSGIWTELGILPPFVIGLELVYQLEEEALKPLFGVQAARARATREPLVQVIKDTINSRKERIHAYEANVKDHLFNSMLLGQLEAAENGGDVMKGIVEAAMRSLREFIPILEAKASMTQKKGFQIETPPSWEGSTGGVADDGFEYDTLFNYGPDFDMYNSIPEKDWDSWL